MVLGSDSTSVDIKKLQASLSGYPDIRVIQSDDFAQNYFEAEYHVKGFILLPDQTVVQDKNHRISITIPFGYPHFPPNVKPLTPIFHPDIDPDAIRIADFWETSKTLDQLLVYIGRMICGEAYNVESPFNLEAAEWYMDNIQILPLDILREEVTVPAKTVSQNEDGDIEETFSIGPGTELSLESSLDTLFTDFDHAKTSTDGQAAEGLDSPGAPSRKKTISLQDIKKNIEQKNFFTAAGQLKEFDGKISDIEKTVLAEEINLAIKYANEIYHQIEGYESEGKLREAKNMVDQLAQTAVDFPGFKDIKARVRGNFALAMSLKLKAKKKFDSPDSDLEKEHLVDLDDQDQAVQVDDDSSIKPQKRSKLRIKKPALSLKVPRISLNVVSIASIIVLIIVVSAGISGYSLYRKDQEIISQAGLDLQKAGVLVEQKNYDKAKTTAEKIQENLKSILFLKQEKGNLEQSVATFLSSTSLKEGLDGKVLYNGAYISAEQAALFTQLDSMEQEAETASKEGDLSTSLEKFQEALALAQDNKLESRASGLTQKINLISLERTLQEARHKELNKEWDNAAGTYEKALELARSLSDKENENVILKQLAATKFRIELTQSKEAFAESQWKQTLEILSRAEQLLKDDPTAVSTAELAQLEQLRINSELYQILSNAGTAYRQRNWQNAIMEYEKGLQLLQSGKEIFGPSYTDSMTKIKKTLLMIRVSMKLGDATLADEKKDLKNALVHYEELAALIDGSEFKDTDELQKVSKKTEAQIKSAKEALNIQEKTEWLTENFRSIFIEFYPSTSSSELLAPKVTFIRKDDHKMLFKLSCVERKQGRSFRLELDYQYSSENDSWSIFTDNW